MAKAEPMRRKGNLGSRMLLVAACLWLASCVPTVTYSPLPSSFESAHRALAAEQTLTHPQTVAGRRSNPDIAPLSFCTAEGLLVEIRNPGLPKTASAENASTGFRLRFRQLSIRNGAGPTPRSAPSANRETPRPSATTPSEGISAAQTVDAAIVRLGKSQGRKSATGRKWIMFHRLKSELIFP